MHISLTEHIVIVAKPANKIVLELTDVGGERPPLNCQHISSGNGDGRDRLLRSWRDTPTGCRLRMAES